VISILGSKYGIKHAADVSSDKDTEIKIMVGDVDAELGGEGGGMIVPG
jgi:hypothetical protein